MITLTNEHIDGIYDAVTMMEVASQLLSDGDVCDKSAGSLSWLLSSVGRRLSGIVGAIERLKIEHEQAASVVIARKPGENAS